MKINKIAIIGNEYWRKILYSKLKNHKTSIINRNNYNRFLFDNTQKYNIITIATPEISHIKIIKDIYKCIINLIINI